MLCCSLGKIKLLSNKRKLWRKTFFALRFLGESWSGFQCLFKQHVTMSTAGNVTKFEALNLSQALVPELGDNISSFATLETKISAALFAPRLKTTSISCLDFSRPASEWNSERENVWAADRSGRIFGKGHAICRSFALASDSKFRRNSMSCETRLWSHSKLME